MIGIHIRRHSFSDRWVEVCNNRRIPFTPVDCLANDVIERCRDLKSVLWHWTHDDFAAQLVARQIIASLEFAGVKVFPNWKTSWHFDDKLAQKYLLEALKAPIIRTWLFLRLEDALAWVEDASWPKVFKLRCGAGSMNVKLVRGNREAYRICQKAFTKGFPAVTSYFKDLKTRIRKAHRAGDALSRLYRAPRMFMTLIKSRRTRFREKGYAYFQDFLPGNAFDTRITIIGERAFGFRRFNREADFRASGSGLIDWDISEIDLRCVQISFSIARAIGAQSIAFDWLYDERKEPKIAEISYAYDASAVHTCPGHWDAALNWHIGRIWPQDAILEDVLAYCRNGQSSLGAGCFK